MTKIAQNVLTLAEKLMSSIDIDTKTGVGTEKGTDGKSLYDSHLPETLTPQVVEEVKSYDAEFVAASAYAFGQLANKAATEDKAFQTATLGMRGGHKDTITHAWDRTRTYTNRLAGDGAEVVKHGVISTTFETKAGKNAGMLKSVRDLIASQMEELAKS